MKTLILTCRQHTKLEMRKLMKRILFLLLITANYACPQARGEIISIGKAIIDQTYNYEFASADRLIEKGLQEEPDNLKYPFLFINNEMIKGMKLRDDALTIHKQSVTDSINNIIIPFAEEVIERFEDRELNIDEKFFIGCIHGYVGRIYGVQGSWMAAFGAVKTGKNLLEEVLEEDPEYYDAYLLLGMLNYFVDRMGGVTGFVASILGLSGDRETGLEYLKIAQEKGTYTKAQATYMLIELYTWMENNEYAAMKYFNQFIKQFPQNVHMVNWYCNELMDVHLTDKVKEIIDNDRYGVIGPYVKGRYYYNTGEYELSNRYFTHVEENIAMYYSYYYDNAIFMMAVNHLMLNNYDEARHYRTGMNENLSPLFDEMASNKKAAGYVVKLGETIGIENRHKEAVAMLSNEPDANCGYPFINNLINYYKGVFFFKSKEYNKACDIFDKLKEDQFFSVDCAKFMLEIYSIINAGADKAEELIDFIDDMDNEALTYRAKDIEKKYDL